MTDLNYEHLARLDDPKKPWRKVWRCPATGVHVKTHAKRKDTVLGKIVFEITVSACDEEGAALRRADGTAAVLHGSETLRPHLLQVAPEASRDDVEPIADRLDRELRFMVARVERAVLNEREAAKL
jgi:hypothetical protein